jgi:hypothetical protein
VGSDERESEEREDEWGKIVEKKVGLTTILAVR